MEGLGPGSAHTLSVFLGMVEGARQYQERMNLSWQYTRHTRRKAHFESSIPGICLFDSMHRQFELMQTNRRLEGNCPLDKDLRKEKFLRANNLTNDKTTSCYWSACNQLPRNVTPLQQKFAHYFMYAHVKSSAVADTVAKGGKRIAGFLEVFPHI